MDGLLCIDKPAGITSHDVVDAVRRIAHTRAVGHAGTLDPFATGLLILGINKATKWLTALVGLDKEYDTTLQLGATSDTFDPEGHITPWTEKIMDITVDQLEMVLQKFRGTMDQRAPLFSAKKIHGKKLYELARSGRADDSMRPIKRVTIHKLDVQHFLYPELRLLVNCSSGTYIRSLADDIGRELHTGAYVTGLRRVSIGPYVLARSIPLHELTSDNLTRYLHETINLDNKAQN